MIDHDELLARADHRVRGGTGFVEYDHGKDATLIRELRDALRTALATRADDEDRLIAQAYRAGKAAAGSAIPTRRITGEPPGWEGTRALHDRHVAGSATPTEIKQAENPRPGIAHDFYCTHNPCRCDPETDRAAELNAIAEADAAAGSATPTGDDDG
jgi:hypothetical protein